MDEPSDRGLTLTDVVEQRINGPSSEAIRDAGYLVGRLDGFRTSSRH